MPARNTERIEHALTPYFRRRPIQPARAKFLHRLYLLLRNAPDSVSADSKQRSFEAAAAGEHHWEVVAISEGALRSLHDHQDRRLIQRGHAFSRNDRFLHLFGQGTKPVSQNALVQFYFEHDASALVTVKENTAAGSEHWSNLYPVPVDLFPAAGFSVKYRKRVERLWVKAQVEQIDSNSRR